MNAILNGIFVGAEPEIEIEKGDELYRVQNCTFQEHDEYGDPMTGRYVVVEIWNEKIEEYLNPLRIGDKVEAQVEVITRRKHNKAERYRNRITLVSLTKN